jgi:hypothetical protein
MRFVVLDASAERLELIADGPIPLGVRYVMSPKETAARSTRGCRLSGPGLPGRVFAEVAEALLACGALRLSLRTGSRRSCRSSADAVRVGLPVSGLLLAL